MNNKIRNKSRKDLNGEAWKGVCGYDGVYLVSNFGRVKNSRRGNIVLACIVGGYFRHILSCEGKTRGFYTHRLVAMSFIPNPQKKPHVNHKNGIKTDNKINNLEWCTASENHVHAVKIGLKKAPSTLGRTGSLCSLSKPVIKMDLRGNFIKEFPSATLAAASVGKKRAECIAHCARGESNTSAGFKWKYAK